MKNLWFFICVFGLLSFTQETPEDYVVKNIKALKEGVLLVRLHEDLTVQKKMLELKQYKRLEAKKEEIERKNVELIDAFKKHYSFSHVYFFYARNTNEVIAKNYAELVFDTANQIVDTSKLLNTPVYILDGENVHFEHFGEDAEGYGIYNDTLGLMQKPFPYYVRKRSGTLIVQRTEYDMVIKLQRKLDKTYNKYFQIDLD